MSGIMPRFRCGICSGPCTDLVLDPYNERPHYLGFYVSQRVGGDSSTCYMDKAEVERLIAKLQRLVGRMA